MAAVVTRRHTAMAAGHPCAPAAAQSAHTGQNPAEAIEIEMKPPQTLQRIAAVLFASLAVSSAAHAQEAHAQQAWGGRLKALDRDGDGTLGADEARAGLQAQFARLDADHDGVISEREFVDARMQQFSAADSDGDSRLTRSELIEHFRAMRQQN